MGNYKKSIKRIALGFIKRSFEATRAMAIASGALFLGMVGFIATTVADAPIIAYSAFDALFLAGASFLTAMVAEIIAWRPDNIESFLDEPPFAILPFLFIVVPVITLISAGQTFYNDVGCAIGKEISLEHKISTLTPYDLPRGCNGELLNIRD